ncbi:ABC-three component system middle component 6 [Nostoc sp. NIES-2111]
MILPDKNISIEHSLLYTGSEVLSKLDGSPTIASLWLACKDLPSVQNYTRFVLALDFLFIIGAIDYKRSRLSKPKHDTVN